MFELSEPSKDTLILIHSYNKVQYGLPVEIGQEYINEKFSVILDAPLPKTFKVKK